jgi:hypothetical protein
MRLEYTPPMSLIKLVFSIVDGTIGPLVDTLWRRNSKRKKERTIGEEPH